MWRIHNSQLIWLMHSGLPGGKYIWRVSGSRNLQWTVIRGSHHGIYRPVLHSDGQRSGSWGHLMKRPKALPQCTSSTYASLLALKRLAVYLGGVSANCTGSLRGRGGGGGENM